MSGQHIPVLLNEVIQYLAPKPNENFIDCTIGFAGHSKAILERNKPNGKVLGIELDPEIYQELRRNDKGRGRVGDIPDAANQVSGFRFHDNLILVNDSYVNLKEIAEEHNFKPVHGILFDLGMSSWHLEESGRGFSFQKEEPLIMRYAHNQSKILNLKSKIHPEGALRYRSVPYGAGNLKVKSDITAEDIVNGWSEEELARIFRDYGQEYFAKNIARKIVESRKTKSIKTTLQLVEVIKKAVPRSYQFGRTHFATRTFQALRLAVNQELENIKAALPQALEILEKGGRITVLSFHSLEDRIVKHFFRQAQKENSLQILTKKPITASIEEARQNPRARSVKLRAAIKTI